MLINCRKKIVIKLIVTRHKNYHVSLDSVYEFENSISVHPEVKRINNNVCLSKISYFIYNKLKKVLPLKYIIQLANKNTHLVNGGYFIILMGCSFKECMPFFLLCGSRSLYLFDAWPNTHKTIINFANDLAIDNVFLSSSKAAEMLSKHKSNCKFFWVPEGINLNEYKYYPYNGKNIDVIQIGRKYDIYHKQIVEFLDEMQKTYLFEKVKGEIIFPTRQMFLDGLARSKISVCFPSNITHPERAMGIETMTIRYLQSMASKCLIVGKAPIELIKLFGYNPVIEVDISNSKEQLSFILSNYNTYLPLIEKNYNNLSNHTWSKRWQQIERLIAQ
jgi:hypothetical protein